ncbi:MAG: hypothetical protein HKM89_07545 [Gemmatimonadales bacterium]|nr:hypothetical protein [Gemmatimonadales bacterium]
MHRLFFITYSGTHPSLVTDVLKEKHVTGYTCVQEACGEGVSGPRQGSRAFPGQTALFFSVVPADRYEDLVRALKAQARSMPDGERLHVSTLGVEEFF